MRESPYRILEEALRPHLGARAQVVLEEGLKRLGKRPEELSEKDAETLLKGLIFRELQARLPAAQARRAVEEALARLAPAPEGGLEALERGLARFGLYVDWPEVGRLRALVNRLRREPDPRLLQEGLALLDHLEEKLEEALLRQAQDLAHLEEALERVRPLGGPKVRRLESLIQIVREAHREGTLAQGEVERARALALELRKYLASSAVQPATLPEMVFETQEEDVLVTVEEAPALEEELVIDLESLAEPQAQEIRALEVAEEKRRLEELVLRYAPFLDHPRAAALRAEVEALLEADQPALEKLTELEAALKEAEAEAKAARRARLIQLEEALRRFPGLARPLLAENLLNEGRAGEAEALGFSGPRLFLRQGRPAEALELLKRAEDPGLHRPPQNHREGSLLRALLECVAGDAEEGLRFAERGRFEAEALGSPFGLSLAEARKGHALLALGRLREAEASYRAALALSEGGPARLGVEALGGLAALGDDGAYREMVRLSRASGDLWVEGFLTLVVALARLRLGEEFPLGAFPAPDPFLEALARAYPFRDGWEEVLERYPFLAGRTLFAPPLARLRRALWRLRRLPVPYHPGVRVEVRALGGFEVRVEGRPVRFRREKARLLLALLTVRDWEKEDLLEALEATRDFLGEG